VRVRLFAPGLGLPPGALMPIGLHGDNDVADVIAYRKQFDA
jgi:hypothetical protein